MSKVSTVAGNRRHRPRGAADHLCAVFAVGRADADLHPVEAEGDGFQRDAITAQGLGETRSHRGLAAFLGDPERRPGGGIGRTRRPILHRQRPRRQHPAGRAHFRIEHDLRGQADFAAVQVVGADPEVGLDLIFDAEVERALAVEGLAGPGFERVCV